MIFVFHTLYFVFKFALKIYRKHKALKEFEKCKEERQLEDAKQAEIDLEQVLSFDPPVYRQRYASVQQILLDERWRKDIKRIVDFGCAEFGFFQYMKHLIGVTEILEVDIDEDLMLENKCKIQPLTADYLKERTDPLLVNVFCGSIGEPDLRLQNIDAVIAIEIIEHLYPDTLDELTYNIFGYIKPRIAIFTTPNADFNVLFPNFKGFRHNDHKFEWTREQFADWCDNQVTRFPEYSVEICGVGEGPKGTESLGCCSQMAVFIKQYVPVPTELNDGSGEDISDNTSFGICTYYSYINHLREFMRKGKKPNCDSRETNRYYKLIESINYPFREDKRSQDQKILDEAMYRIYRNATVKSKYYNEDTNLLEIPLRDLVFNFDGFFLTPVELRRILEEAQFTVQECVLYGSKERCLCVVYDIEMEKGSSDSSGSYNNTQEENTYIVNTEAEEANWDNLYDQAPLQAELTLEKKDVLEAEDLDQPSDQLFDSGYQKSTAEWSPQSPMDGVFEEQFNDFVKLDVNDIKETAKANVFGDLKITNNKVLTERRNLSSVSKKSPQKETPKKESPQKESLPSTSDYKKRKKSPKPDEIEDEGIVRDEVKNITSCIVYNCLNKVFIEDGQSEDPVPLLPVPVPEPNPEIPYIVENGDLANNNRDNEGNNYPDDIPAAPFYDIEDNINENRENFVDNIEERVDADQENQNLPQPADAEEGAAAIANVAQPLAMNVEAALPPVMAGTDEEMNLNHASREALFDPNSQQDMLEDMLLPDSSQASEDVDQDDGQPILIGMNLLTTENEFVNQQSEFPNWLLQMLGQQSEDENHDEPHFYCQGDGLGVHPSIIEVDVEDSSSDTSSNDDAEAERTISEDEVGSLPTDGNSVLQPILEVVGLNVPLHVTHSAMSNESNDEFFDTIDDTGNNCDEGKE